MRFNATVDCWRPDNESVEGSINSTTGRFEPGSTKQPYVSEEPCLVQGFSRTENRDFTEFGSANDPARVSLDVISSTFKIGDYVLVTYRDVESRLGEIRSIGYNSRGRRQTTLIVEWRQAEA